MTEHVFIFNQQIYKWHNSNIIKAYWKSGTEILGPDPGPEALGWDHGVGT